MYGTIETVCTFDKIEQLYYAKKRTIEEGFADWNARYIAHFSHWFPWGVMVYDRFVIDEPPQDADRGAAAAQPDLDSGGAHIAGVRRRC